MAVTPIVVMGYFVISIPTMNKFDFLRQLSRYPVVPEQYGNIETHALGPLRLLSYGREAQRRNIWTPAERLCRGVIINIETGEIVALPFAKFFNYGQHTVGEQHLPLPSATLSYVMEKKDGSLGILYRDQGSYRVATRGAFSSDQAIWATAKLRDYHLTKVPVNYTLCLEIIYPDNAIVVDYQATEELFLLGGFDRFTGQELNLETLTNLSDTTGLPMPTRYSFKNYEEVITFINRFSGRELEGAVMVYDDGSRFKVKGDAYVALHAMISNLSTRKIHQLWMQGDHQSMLTEFAKETSRLLEKTYNDTMERIRLTYSNCPHGVTRREFALYVQKNVPVDIRAYMFMLLDGQDGIEDRVKHATLSKLKE